MSSIPLLKEGSTWHYWVVTRETNSLFSKYFRFLLPLLFFCLCLRPDCALIGSLFSMLCMRIFFFFFFLDEVVFGIEFAIGLRSFEW